MSELATIPPGALEHREPAAAFFDLDRTLISGSSAFVFGVSAWRAKMLPTSQFARDARSALAFKIRGDHRGNVADGVRERILGAVKGIAQESLIGLNETIVPRLLERLRPEARELLELHRRAGRATYIVSASPVELVEPLAKALGMTAGIGTVSEVVDGLYTGNLAGPFCYAEGKVDAIRAVAAREGFDLGQCYAYSDSISDLPMLEAVGHPVAVNPDKRLHAIAIRRGWPIVIFARKTKAVVKRTTAAAGTAALAAGSFAAGYRMRPRRRW